MGWLNRTNVYPSDEAEIVRRSQRGEVDAFNHLVERYQQAVFNLAYRTLGNLASAEDIAQETFLAAFQHLRDYRGGSLRGWLFRITLNRCYDHLRRAGRHASVSLDLLDEGDHPIDPPDPAESPVDYTVRQEMGHQLQLGLQHLPVEQRTVLILCDIQGLSYTEAADAMGTSIGTVKSRLSRARRALRDYLSATGYLD